MVWQSKKTLFILLSLVFGGLVILGAAKMAGVFNTGASTASTENSGWETALSVLPSSAALTRVGKGNAEIDEKAASATTTTDIIARRILIEYALSKKDATSDAISDADVKNIANTLAKEIKLPPKKQYQLSDLNISKDNSYDANLSYIKTISTLLKNFVATGQKETELTILVSAIDTKNMATLDQLKTKVAIYQELIKNLLVLKTPSLIAPLHLRLLQSYETLRSATVGLQSMLADPALGISALAEYRNGFEALSVVENEYRTFKFTN